MRGSAIARGSFCSVSLSNQVVLMSQVLRLSPLGMPGHVRYAHLSDLLFGVDTGSFGSIQALPAFLRDFAPLNAAGNHVFPTEVRSIMNAMVWPSKLAGCIFYEPLVSRVGYKITLIAVALLVCKSEYVNRRKRADLSNA
jgi:hypothetical protein